MGLTTADLHRLGASAQQQILQQMSAKPSKKFHNNPTTSHDIHFDSKKEANRYEELMTLLRMGKIRKLRLQPQYTLQESYMTPEGERVRAIRYVADFSYEKPVGDTWTTVVEDVKSKATKTPQYKLKKKLMQERYNISITEI